MIDLDTSKWPEYLQHQRWFGGKAFPIKSVSVIDHARLPHATPRDRDAVLAVVEVHYELGAQERYLLALMPGADGDIAEALHQERFSLALFDLLAHGGSVPAGSGALRGEVFPGAKPMLAAVGLRPPVKPIAQEQSNSSIVFADRVILKVIRKLDAGLNPEYEVGRFLAKAGFRATPALLGAIHFDGLAGTTLAVAHEFIPNARDGWSYVRETLREHRNVPAALLREIEALGSVVGELHVALASDPSQQGFAPEPVQLEDLQRWSASIIGELGVTLANATRMFPKVFDRRDAAVERARRLAHIPAAGLKIRVHGDLHLGQVLRSGDRWLVFDFEGEPSRRISQRRELQSPAKDVAGMLRSFSYADATLAAEGHRVPGRASQLRRAFIQGYLASASKGGFLPPLDDFERVLDAFELEKLLYEVRYELSNRPDWAHIPISDLMNDAAASAP